MDRASLRIARVDMDRTSLMNIQIPLRDTEGSPVGVGLQFLARLTGLARFTGMRSQAELDANRSFHSSEIGVRDSSHLVQQTCF